MTDDSTQIEPIAAPQCERCQRAAAGTWCHDRECPGRPEGLRQHEPAGGATGGQNRADAARAAFPPLHFPPEPFGAALENWRPENPGWVSIVDFGFSEAELRGMEYFGGPLGGGMSDARLKI